MSVSYIEITEEEEGQRIDNFLFSNLKGVPKTHVYKIIRKGEIRVNGKRIKQTYKLEKGDTIRVPPIRIAKEPEVDQQKGTSLGKKLLDCIIYEDDHVMVLNKPAKIAVHGGTNNNLGVIESLRLAAANPKLELIHRIDKDTSGCLLIAKKRSGLRNLQSQIRENKLGKRYLALLNGTVKKKFKIEAPLLKNTLSSGERVVKVDFEQGKPSTSIFTVEKIFENFTLVNVKLITGRTHQIRVHSKYAGHSIAGDPKYGDKESNSHAKNLGLNRMFLHASELQFISPTTNKVVIVKADLDKNLTEFLTRSI